MNYFPMCPWCRFLHCAYPLKGVAVFQLRSSHAGSFPKRDEIKFYYEVQHELKRWKQCCCQIRQRNTLTRTKCTLETSTVSIVTGQDDRTSVHGAGRDMSLLHCVQGGSVPVIGVHTMYCFALGLLIKLFIGLYLYFRSDAYDAGAGVAQSV
jgi:hypothetical protein